VEGNLHQNKCDRSIYGVTAVNLEERKELVIEAVPFASGGCMLYRNKISSIEMKYL
jgi:hypothetical protein